MTVKSEQFVTSEKHNDVECGKGRKQESEADRKI